MQVWTRHQISASGISPLPSRVTALREHPVPKDRATLQRFLGLINYYHRFIPQVAGMLAPLHQQASGKGKSITWSDDCQKAFYKVKEALSQVTLLHHPRPDAPTSLTVDASNTALGAQLKQRQGKNWQPIAFFSLKLSTAEKKYSGSIKHFKHFLEGRKFTLYTDHKPLTTAINSQSDRSPRQTRHLSYISEFTTDIQHVKGKHNVVADALSRLSSVANPGDQQNVCQTKPSIHHTKQEDYELLAADQQKPGVLDPYLNSKTGLVLSLKGFPFSVIHQQGK